MGEEVDNKAYFKGDIFSIGIIIWELFANKEAFRGLSEFNIMNSITKGHRPKLDEISNFEIQSIIDGCWKQDPNDRLDLMTIFNNLSKAEEGL